MEQPASGPHFSMGKGQRRMLGLFLGGAIGVLAVAGIAVTAARFIGVGWWSIAMMPAELRSAFFVSVPADAPPVIYTVQGLRFVPQYIAHDPTLLTLASREERVATLYDPKADAYLLSQRGAIITRSKIPIYGASLSPDAQQIAYAQLATATPRTPEQREQTGEWISTLYRTAPGTHVHLGYGFSPYFLDQLHIVRFMTPGLVVSDLASGKSTVILKNPFPKFLASTAQSPDRSRIAWYDPTEGEISVYTVTPESASLVRKVRGSGIAALGNSALYTFENTERETRVWMYPFSGGMPRIVVRLPGSMKITSIVL